MSGALFLTLYLSAFTMLGAAALMLNNIGRDDDESREVIIRPPWAFRGDGGLRRWWGEWWAAQAGRRACRRGYHLGAVRPGTRGRAIACVRCGEPARFPTRRQMRKAGL